MKAQFFDGPQDGKEMELPCSPWELSLLSDLKSKSSEPALFDVYKLRKIDQDTLSYFYSNSKIEV